MRKLLFITFICSSLCAYAQSEIPEDTIKNRPPVKKEQIPFSPKENKRTGLDESQPQQSLQGEQQEEINLHLPTFIHYRCPVCQKGCPPRYSMGHRLQCLRILPHQSLHAPACLRPVFGLREKQLLSWIYEPDVSAKRLWHGTGTESDGLARPQRRPGTELRPHQNEMGDFARLRPYHSYKEIEIIQRYFRK